MTLKSIPLFFLLLMAITSCDDKKEAQAEKERIVFEKTADSLEQLSTKLDTLNTSIKNTSDEIDALLNELNE